MAEYHVGCGCFGIYAGVLNPRNKNEWKDKTECPDEALKAVRHWATVLNVCTGVMSVKLAGICRGRMNDEVQ